MKTIKRLLQRDKERRTSGKMSLPAAIVRVLNRWAK